MNEIGIIKILYKYKIRILAVVLGVGIIVAGISLLSSNKYSSTSAISVQAPEVPLTGEIPPLTVETLRSLIESTSVKWELFQELREEGIIEEGIDFLHFQEMLVTSVSRDQSREKNLLPMVKLTATTRDPELSMVIANRWAAVVLKKTRGIYQSGVDDLSIFTTNIYEKVTRSLLESEEKYTETLLNSNLSVNKMLLEHNGELYSRLTGEAITLEEDVATRTALLKRIKENLAAQEIDGVWIVEIFAKEFAEDGEYVLPVSTELTDRITRTIRNLKRNEQAEADFLESSRLENKFLMLKIKRGQIEEISGEIMKAQTSLSGLDPTYSKLEEELAKISPKIVLSKAIGDEKLWEAYLADEHSNEKESSVMKSEISNPVYDETKKEMVSLSGQINGLKSTITEGVKGVEKLRKEISDLAREVAPLSVKREELRSAVKKDRDLLAYYETAYVADRQGYEVKEKDLADMEIKLTAKKAKLVAIGEEVAGLEKNVFASENKIGRQKRDVDNLTEVSASLAAKAEEIALLSVSMENVSRSGTILLYKAQADPIKVGPRRSRTVLISMGLALLVYSLVLIVNTLVKEGGE